MLRRSTVLLLAVSAVGCDSPTEASAVRVQPSYVHQAWLLRYAAEEISAAVWGRKERGEQEQMLRMEAALPGFGGFYLDSVGEVVVLLTSRALGHAEDARVLIHSRYSQHDDPIIRQLMASAARARTASADYSLSELIAMEQTISRSGKSITGFVGVGASVPGNRVVVYFGDSTSVDVGLGQVRSLGVPSEAVVADVMGPVTASGNFDGFHRPTRGGIVLQIGPAYGQPVADSIYLQSHGFNVVTSPPLLVAHYFLTASHGPNSRYQVNGHVGAPVYQPWSPPYAQYGTITHNPPWDTGPSCNGHTFCTNADVALGTYASGQTYQRKVGTSQTGGINGGYGSNLINNWYAVGSAVPPDLIWSSNSHMHKSGYATGTTSGDMFWNPPFGTACADVVASMSRVGGPGATLLLKCATVIDHAGWGQGDSGGAVFGRVIPGQEYRTLGIQVAGSGALHTSGPHKNKCSAGMNCRVIFHQWSNIEARFGLLLSAVF